MDADVQEVFKLSREKGFQAIIDEARWQMQAQPADQKQFRIYTYSGKPFSS